MCNDIRALGDSCVAKIPHASESGLIYKKYIYYLKIIWLISVHIPTGTCIVYKSFFRRGMHIDKIKKEENLKMSYYYVSEETT